MGSLLELASRMTRMAASLHHEMDGGHIFEKPAKLLKAEIESAIGTYKYGWPSLAASTLARKGADTPLEQFGAFKASFNIKLGHHEAWVGSSDFRAVWFEMGTSRMPPRPYLQPALKAKHHEIEAEFGNVLRIAIERA